MLYVVLDCPVEGLLEVSGPWMDMGRARAAITHHNTSNPGVYYVFTQHEAEELAIGHDD